MALQAPTPEPVEVPAVHANVGVQMAYQRKLQRLIAQMAASVQWWLKATYRAHPPLHTDHMAQDAPSAMLALRATLDRLTRHWQGRFDELAPEIARIFATTSTATAQRAMMDAFKRAGFTVSFKPTARAMEGLRAVIGENVSLIRSIPEQYLKDVEGQVWRSVAAGGDLQALTNGLTSKYGIAQRRAETIARDQNNKATAVVENIRRQELGIKQAIWQHSGAGKEPRPEHVKAGRDKLVFDLDKGAYLEGKWVLPGQEINCRCTSRSIIPGIDT